MTKEILFKAKRISDGKWADGFYCCIGPAGQEKHYIIPAYASAFYGIEVDPYTVCKYTGLTDSDGKRVFDGDVLKFHDEPNDYEWIGRVEFGNPNGSYTWGWQLVHISGPEPNIDTLCWFDMEEVGVYSEVIGNKFDGGKDDS